MNLSSFVPLMIDLPICAAVLVVGYRKPKLAEGDLVYTYPPFLAFMMLAGAIFFAAVPLLPGAQGDMNPILFNGGFELFALFGIGMALYFLRYRLIVTHERLILRVLLKEEIEFSRIAEVRYIKARDSQLIVMSLAGGRRLTISGFVRDLPALAKTIETRVNASRQQKIGAITMSPFRRQRQSTR